MDLKDPTILWGMGGLYECFFRWGTRSGSTTTKCDFLYVSVVAQKYPETGNEYFSLQTSTQIRLATQVEYTQLSMHILSEQNCSDRPKPGTTPRKKEQYYNFSTLKSRLTWSSLSHCQGMWTPIPTKQNSCDKTKYYFDRNDILSAHQFSPDRRWGLTTRGLGKPVLFKFIHLLDFFLQFMDYDSVDF